MENNKTSILVIEEHPMMRESLCAAIAAETDLQIMESSPVAPDALEIEISPRHDMLFLPKLPDIILLALGNPGIDELKALSTLRKKNARYLHPGLNPRRSARSGDGCAGARCAGRITQVCIAQ